MNMGAKGFDQYLWDTYHPSNIWFLFAGIAILGSILLYLFDRFVTMKIAK
jgi:POT family proton-dependent oligopeptide transporter